ncbi:dynamin family protein [Thalassobacillus sp. C254]|uniref:dynamin family protein n=1 Tax=Thalassobacillus sp. C254 TaxID=1225341 RepID=UPI0006D11840|nr:dynamin family protein [Thalassobacillus sp. C254]
MTITKTDLIHHLEQELPFRKDNQARLEQLKEKQNNETFDVAFCGHFSAGKSTILNHILGAEVLPTSPIPTSANIITIKQGLRP